MKPGKGKLGECLELKVIVGNVTQGQQGKKSGTDRSQGMVRDATLGTCFYRQALPKLKQKGL